MKTSKYQEALDRAAEHVKRIGLADADKLAIYTTLEHVSQSGMMRTISAFVIVDNTPLCIARSVRVSGCGMDMGFHLASSIYDTLHPYINGKQDKPYQTGLVHRWM